jgi:hypothetical protein
MRTSICLECNTALSKKAVCYRKYLVYFCTFATCDGKTERTLHDLQKLEPARSTSRNQENRQNGLSHQAGMGALKSRYLIGRIQMSFGRIKASADGLSAFVISSHSRRAPVAESTSNRYMPCPWFWLASVPCRELYVATYARQITLDCVIDSKSHSCQINPPCTVPAVATLGTLSS